jgi:ubiquinone/menaquinone biosynthesis C-methylase UbiE
MESPSGRCCGFVGPEGRVVGVDLTDAMLAQARWRVERAGWRNVELVQSDAAVFSSPGQGKWTACCRSTP